MSVKCRQEFLIVLNVGTKAYMLNLFSTTGMFSLFKKDTCQANVPHFLVKDLVVIIICVDCTFIQC